MGNPLFTGPKFSLSFAAQCHRLTLLALPHFVLSSLCPCFSTWDAFRLASGWWKYQLIASIDGSKHFMISKQRAAKHFMPLQGQRLDKTFQASTMISNQRAAHIQDGSEGEGAHENWRLALRSSNGVCRNTQRAARSFLWRAWSIRACHTDEGRVIIHSLCKECNHSNLMCLLRFKVPE